MKVKIGIWLALVSGLIMTYQWVSIGELNKGASGLFQLVIGILSKYGLILALISFFTAFGLIYYDVVSRKGGFKTESGEEDKTVKALARGFGIVIAIITIYTVATIVYLSSVNT